MKKYVTRRTLEIVILCLLFLCPTFLQAATTLALSSGWNFISLPQQPANNATDVVLSSVLPDIRVVWGYDNTTKTWQRYKPQPSPTAPNTLASMDAKKGFWIYANNQTTLTVSGADVSPNITLYEGWNLVGYYGVDGAEVTTALNDVSRNWSIIWGWEGGAWTVRAYDPSANLSVSPLEQLYQGKAYWIKTMPEPLTGGIFGTGDFKITITDGTMPPSIKAIAPKAIAESSVPEALTIRTNEINVTSGAKAYTLNLAESGFITGSGGAVSIEVPFDPKLIPDPTKLNSLNLFLRILNRTDNTAVNVDGTISVNKIITPLKGLPAQMTVIVVYNPDMKGVVGSDESLSPQGQRSPQETSSTWGARHWFVVYDEKAVSAEIKTFLELGREPTSQEIAGVVKTQIADHAVQAANIYKYEYFRSPDLHIKNTAADPGGDVLGTTPRYIIYFCQAGGKGAFYSGYRADEPIDAENNHYGRIYIEPQMINKNRENYGVSVFGVIAHEMLHSIQYGYDIGKIGNIYKGIKEGTATAYGEMLDRRHHGDSQAIPAVRQLSGAGKIEREKFLVDDYLMDNNLSEDKSYAYSNQDFFVYVARKYGGNNYKYAATLFEQLNQDMKTTPITTEADAWKTLHKSMDTAFQTLFSKSLKDIYLEFVRQRAMEHNTESQFGRPDETTSGPATNVFSDNYIWTAKIDPNNIELMNSHLGWIRPFATRAFKITPSAVAAGTIKEPLQVLITPRFGTIGKEIDGSIYVNGVLVGSLAAQTEFKDFGRNITDEIFILVSNTSMIETTDFIIITTKKRDKVVSLGTPIFRGASLLLASCLQGSGGSCKIDEARDGYMKIIDTEGDGYYELTLEMSWNPPPSGNMTITGGKPLFWNINMNYTLSRKNGTIPSPIKRWSAGISQASGGYGDYNGSSTTLPGSEPDIEFSMVPVEIGSYEKNSIYTTSQTIPVTASLASSGPGGVGEGYIALRGWFKPEMVWGHNIEFEIVYVYPEDTP